jgi:uncharacterized membrane protein YqgA involved in biofilm formation|tara:strand:- start:836 stop:997 length:162 start_codon:yes stop_codon:yes gene_type:complete
MPLTTEEFILFAAIIGLLIGVVVGLRYIVNLERKIESLEKSIKKALPVRKRKR